MDSKYVTKDELSANMISVMKNIIRYGLKPTQSIFKIQYCDYVLEDNDELTSETVKLINGKIKCI